MELADWAKVQFKATLAALQEETSFVEREHGFKEFKDTPLYVVTKLALISSEVSEALEADRKGLTEEFPSELADIVIRTMNLAEDLNINLGQAILDKNEKNKSRPFKHGNKKY